ncbi:MAG: lipopolysaccharide heptosyltransferase II, partial [Acidobacteriota bacterium]
MRIVIQGTNWIGDAVISIAALREVRRVFPEAYIALHTRSWAEGIFLDAEFLDEISTYEHTGSKLTNWFVRGRKLRRGHFDLAVLFPNSFESALMMKWAGIPRRFGYATDARSSLLTDAVPVPEWKSSRHEVFFFLNLVEQVEKALRKSGPSEKSEPKLELTVSAGRRERARDILRAAGADLKKPTIALGVGSTNSRAKRWPAADFASLTDSLRTQLGANVVLLGSKNEGDVAASVAGLAKQPPIILTGKTNLEEATAILSEIDLFISNDMGLAHIAPAVGTKTLVIFGPTDPVTTAPFSPLAHVIREPVECSPCMLRDCPIDHR